MRFSRFSFPRRGKAGFGECNPQQDSDGAEWADSELWHLGRILLWQLTLCSCRKDSYFPLYYLQSRTSAFCQRLRIKFWKNGREKNGLPCKPFKKHILDLWEINLRSGRAGTACACPPCLPKSETSCGCQWRVSVYLDHWRVQPVLLSFVMNL